MSDKAVATEPKTVEEKRVYKLPQEAVQQLNQINAQVNMLIAGVRMGLGVPPDFVYDPKRAEFVAGVPEKTTD